MLALSGGDAGPQGACISCHGINGEGNGSSVPRIAGLGVGYLTRQMEFFAAGLRRQPQMHRIARRLSGAERQAVSAYYASMPYVPSARAVSVPAPKLYVAGDPSRNLPSCASCHGARGEGRGAGNPPLAGQPAAYLAEQLRLWRLGERRGDPDNLMLKISRRLTDSEIAEVAAYAARLPGNVPHPERSGP